MGYHECPECGEEVWIDCDYGEEKKVITDLEATINKKIMDLQTQLIRHYAEDGFKLEENDLIRYSAMVEVLKAVLQ